MHISSPTLIILSSILLTACSSTPDRYAFWRDDAPAAVNSPITTTGNKPNLGNIPAAPDVTTAREEMENLQTKLAADRQSAYQQAQMDQATLPTGPRGSAVTVSDPALPPSPIKGESLAPVTAFDIAHAQAAAITAPTSLNAPAMVNPNRAPLPGLPVYTPPSVQVTRAVNPLPQQGEIGPYVYGRSGVQYRQRMDQQAPMLTPPASISADASASKSITVDMSALGGASFGGTKGSAPRGSRAFASPAFLQPGAPTIYFNHGSTRLSANDRKTLSAIASEAASGRTVKVIGHASKRAETGSTLAAKEANLKISATRASAVMKELAKNGVKAQQIKPIAVGDADARETGSEKADRRVDIVVE